MTKFPMTIQGARALEEELKHLKTVLRPQITQAIAEARELGDLKENAEYHAAREQQGMVEARIRDIEGRLQNRQHCTDRQGDLRYHRGHRQRRDGRAGDLSDRR